MSEAQTSLALAGQVDRHVRPGVEATLGPVVQCDCTTRVAADGTRTTFCGSAQMASARSFSERDVREACVELRDALGNPVISGTMEQTLHGQVIRAATAKLRELQAELAATQRAWRDDSNAKALEIAKATTLLTDTLSACKHRGDPRGCHRVRCQLDHKCVEA